MATSPASATEQSVPSPETPIPAPTPIEALPGNTVDTPQLETLNSLKDIQDALKESAKTLLQLGDGPGIMLVAQAAQCGETPMGRELQYNVLDMMRHISSRKLKDQIPLVLLRQKLGKLQYPNTLPTEHMTKFINDHKASFPPGYEPARIALMLNTGKTNMLSIGNEINSNQAFAALRQPYLEAVMGNNVHVLDQPVVMLQQVGLKNADIAKVMKMGSPHRGFDKSLAIGVGFLAASMVLSWFQENQQPAPAMHH